MKRTATAVTILVLALCAGLANAEQKRRFDNTYDVHYSVVNSAFLTPHVAKSYGITRGQDHYIVNIAVREIRPDGSTVARKATVSGTRFDLIHRRPLDFKEIDERTAVYYIAQFEANDQEKLDFSIDIHPETSQRSYKLKFNKVMHRNHQ